MICLIKVGNVVDAIINILTLGWGKDIAGWISLKFFNNPDCGCEKRRIYLNNLFGCSEGLKLK